MKKHLRILTVTYAPGRFGVNIDVQQELVDDDGTETPLGLRETVETNQDALGAKNWGDKDVERIVAEATVEVEPATEADAANKVAAKAAVTALRFPDLEIVY